MMTITITSFSVYITIISHITVTTITIITPCRGPGPTSRARQDDISSRRLQKRVAWRGGLRDSPWSALTRSTRGSAKRGARIPESRAYLNPRAPFQSPNSSQGLGPFVQMCWLSLTGRGDASRDCIPDHRNRSMSALEEHIQTERCVRCVSWG